MTTTFCTSFVPEMGSFGTYAVCNRKNLVHLEVTLISNPTKSEEKKRIKIFLCWFAIPKLYKNSMLQCKSRHVNC